VPTSGIEPLASPLPRECSTPELRGRKIRQIAVRIRRNTAIAVRHVQHAKPVRSIFGCSCQTTLVALWEQTHTNVWRLGRLPRARRYFDVSMAPFVTGLSRYTNTLRSRFARGALSCVFLWGNARVCADRRKFEHWLRSRRRCWRFSPHSLHLLRQAPTSSSLSSMQQFILDAAVYPR
jgi:hypothetical protein